MKQSGSSAGGGAAEWIEHKLPFVREGENQPLRQANRKLAGMRRFLHVISCYIGDVPHILRIFAERVAGKLSLFLPFEVPFAGIF